MSAPSGTKEAKDPIPARQKAQSWDGLGYSGVCTAKWRSLPGALLLLPLSLAADAALAQTPQSAIETRPVISSVGETSTHVCRRDAFVELGGQRVSLGLLPCTRQFAPLPFSHRDRVSVATPPEAAAVALGSGSESGERAVSCSRRAAGHWSCPGRAVDESARGGLVTIGYPGGGATWSFDVQVLPYGQRATDRGSGLSFWLAGNRLRVQPGLPKGPGRPDVAGELLGRRITAVCMMGRRPGAPRRLAIASLEWPRHTGRSVWFELRPPLPGRASACLVEHSRSGRDVAVVWFDRR
jgi:hypothetical protein